MRTVPTKRSLLADVDLVVYFTHLCQQMVFLATDLDYVLAHQSLLDPICGLFLDTAVPSLVRFLLAQQRSHSASVVLFDLQACRCKTSLMLLILNFRRH